MSQTATETMMRTELRARRARSLLAAVMNKIDPLLGEQQDSVRRDVYDALLDLFHSEGVDIITDRDRADAGLPPRGPDGLTAEEMLAMERKRLEALSAPIFAMAL